MKKEEKQNMSVLTNREVVEAFGGYAPPEGWWDDMLTLPTIPEKPKPIDPVCW